MPQQTLSRTEAQMFGRRPLLAAGCSTSQAPPPPHQQTGRTENIFPKNGFRRVTSLTPHRAASINYWIIEKGAGLPLDWQMGGANS